MKGVNTTKRFAALFLAVIMLVCTLSGGLTVSAATVYLCNPTSLTAVYNTETETMTYNGTFTGIMQDTRTYAFSLNSGNSMITISNVEGSEMNNGDKSFTYSFHLGKELLDEFATPWEVTLSSFTDGVIAPYTAEVAVVDGIYYTVTFVDWDGSVIDSQSVKEGASASAPDAPLREGYSFTGWDKEFESVTANTTVTAQYAVESCNIRFLAGEGGSITGDEFIIVDYGTDISTLTYPSAAADYGYTFVGWSVAEGTVTDNLVITAMFDKDESLWHEVRFTSSVGGVLNGTTVYSAILNGTDFSDLAVPEPIANTGYVFAGWTPAFADTVEGDLKYTAMFEYVGDIPVAMNITDAYYYGGCVTVEGTSLCMQDQWDVAVWLISDGSTSTFLTVKYGAIANGENSFSYTFDVNPSDISGDVYVYVKPVTVDIAADSAPVDYSLYTVTFLTDGNGSLEGTSVYTGILNGTAFDKAITVPTPIPNDGYSFVCWTPEFSDAVDGDLTYTATFVANTYTVTFVDYDGSILKTETVNHGDSVSAPSDPVREGYTFTGWNKAFDNITADLTVTAQYSIKVYNVIFVDYDGSVLKTQTVSHGASATAPAVTREGYDFTGWDKTFDNVTASITVTAQYSIKTYTVTFVDYDGSILKTETVNHGDSVIAPSDPVREGYTFTGWDKAFDNITADLTVTAQYSIKVYNVIFVDYDGSVLKTQTVSHGASATAPAVTREGYDFTGWDKAFDNVTASITVTAQYSIKTYTVTFVDYDGSILKTETVNHGDSVSAPSNPVREGYTFTGWDKAFDNVTADLTVTAQYSIKVYNVIFVDYDGSVLKTQTVSHGASATAPAVTREGYDFTGWDKAFDNVTASITVTAQYSIKTYTVTFVDYDGSILKTETVNHGDSVSAPSNPVREGYTFTGWDKAFDNITADLTVTAQYSIKVYNVIFVDYDGSVLKTQTVSHGASATAPAVTREGYDFTGWDKAFDNVTASMTVTAQYSIKTYTVTFVDYDGSVLKTGTVNHGDSVSAPSDPVREGYTFTGWDKAFDNVTADLTVTAVYTSDKVTVTFVIEGAGGSIVGTAVVSVEIGTVFDSLTAPEVKADSGYIFAGFDFPEGTVEENAEIKGKFYLKGDVNFDGEVDSLDAAQMLRYDAGITEFDSIGLLVGDVNGDGEVDSLDAAKVLKYDAGLITEL